MPNEEALAEVLERLNSADPPSELDMEWYSVGDEQVGFHVGPNASIWDQTSDRFVLLRKFASHICACGALHSGGMLSFYISQQDHFAGHAASRKSKNEHKRDSSQATV